MAGRIVVCQFCREKTVPWSKRFDLMEIVEKVSESTGNKKNLYYHKDECWEKHLKEQEITKKEYDEQCELDAVIKKIHQVQFNIPSRIWSMIQDLRNGTNRFQKFWKKKYKEGVPFAVIKEAYILSRQDIEWAKLNKRFQSTEAEMKYCLMIVQGKVEDARKKMHRTEQSKKMENAVEQRQVEYMSDEREIVWKKKEDKLDMSSILGND